MDETRKNAEATGQAAKALLDQGVALGRLNRTEDAINTYREVVAKYGAWKELEVAVPVAWALYNMGNALDRLNRLEEAIQSYEKSIEIYGQRLEAELALPVAQALCNMGFTLGQLNRPIDQIKTYDEVADKFGDRQETGLALMVAKALFNKGVALGRMNRTEEAIKSYGEVAESFGGRREVELADQVACALKNKGHALSRLNRLAEAVQTHGEALERYADRKETVLASQVAWALVDKGVALNGLNRPQDAIEAYEAASARYGNQGEDEFAAPLAQALVNKGNALRRLNRLDESLQSYEEAVQKYGDRKQVKVAGPVANALVNKGVCLIEANRDEEAVKTCREVLERYGNREEEEFETPLVEALMNMCVVLNKMDRSGEAVEIFKEVVAKFDHPVEGGTTGPITRIKLAHAPENLGRWAENCLKTPNSPNQAEVAFLLTQSALSLVLPDNVLYPKLRHSHAMAMRWKDISTTDVPGVYSAAAEIDREAWKSSYAKAPQEAILVAMEWADWAWDHERWEEASEAYALAHRALRQLVLNQIDNSDRLELLKHFRFATRGAYAFAKLGNAKDAIVLLERASDLLFSGDRQRWELTRLAQNHPDLRDRLIAAQISKISAHEERRVDPLGQLSPEEVAAQTEANAIAVEIRKTEGFASFALPSGWQDVQEAASKMPVVYIVPTDKGCACFFLKAADGQVNIIDIPVTTADFAVAAKEFVESEFGDVPADEHAPLVQLLQWLGAYIMMSVKQQLHLVGNDDLPFAIIPFGYCSIMPLHAACLEREDPTRLWFLFHPRNVTYAYSARNLVESQRRSSEPPASPALVINNPKPLPPEFDPLLLADAEAAVVNNYFSTKVLPGFQATPSAVCEALPDARVAHFICHGEVESRIGYSGILILSNGAELTYKHLQQLPRFSARLVVLSACRSGAAAITVEHVINLPGAFLAAGAAAVLGTFWHSEEMSSLLLVQRFYELWTDGAHSPVQALGDAQAWLMSSTADTLRASVKPEVLQSPAARRLRDTPGEERVFKHPWYWAGFFLAGA